MDVAPLPADAGEFAPSWLCPGPLERQRALELSALLGRNSAALGLLVWASCILTALDTSPWALAAGVSGIGFPLAARRLGSCRRPELLLFGASAVYLAGLTIGIATSGGLRSPLVAWSVFAVIGVGARCGVRGITVLSACVLASLLLAVAVAGDAAPAGRLPTLFSLVGAIVASTLYGRTIVSAEFSHREASLLDPLTGLLNRKALEPRFEELRQQAVQSGGRICLIMCDLDHFKRINDNYGHDRGDAVLKDVAYEMRKALRTFELIYRMGGEEFLVVLAGATAAEGTAIAERLRTTVATCHPGGVRATASLGVSAAAGRAIDFDRLFRAADEALYRAKAAGRDRVVTAGATAIVPVGLGAGNGRP